MIQSKLTSRGHGSSSYLQSEAWPTRPIPDDQEKPFFLLQLPGELRNLIYEFVLLDDYSQCNINAVLTRVEYNEIQREKEIAMRRAHARRHFSRMPLPPYEPPERNTNRYALGLVSVNRQIYAETLTLLHARIKFSTSFGLEPFGIDSYDMLSSTPGSLEKRLRLIKLANSDPELMPPYRNARKVHFLIDVLDPIEERMMQWISCNKWSILRGMVDLTELTLEFFADERTLRPLRERLLEPVLSHVRGDCRVTVMAAYTMTS